MNTELIKRAKNGDKNALDTIIKENVGLIWSIVRKFANRGYEFEDLFQIGSIGLIKAVKNFDLNFNVKFSTYAVPMIMGEIKRFLRDDGMIKVSRSIKETALKVVRASNEIEAKTGREPKISEIADFLNISSEDVAVALDSICAPESLNKTLNDNKKNPVYLIDSISKQSFSEVDMIDKIALKSAIVSLDERDRKIIILRYFRGKTQTEIASMLGISQVQVSRLEKKILCGMKKMIS